jgi:hypothetical protein
MPTISIEIPSHIPVNRDSLLYYQKAMMVVLVNDGDISVDDARQFFLDNPGDTPFDQFWRNASYMADQGPYTQELRSGPRIGG